MVYVHIPFCRSFCTYCGFYSELAARRVDKSGLYVSYTAAVLSEIERRRREIEDSLSTNTLYIGGGTPSVLPLSYMEAIVKSLGVESYDEFTMEVNPEDIVEKGEEYVRSLMAIGVNRISMGVQSFDDCMLKWMNRRHDSARAKEAFSIIRSAGIKNISIDLIFGISTLGDEAWVRTVQEALRIGDQCGGRPQHISAYQLSIEPDSALEEQIKHGLYTEASEEKCWEQYSLLCRLLAEQGYRHYEISNFALPGFEARHNSAYWARVPYVGLGAGAHSFDGRTRRWNSELMWSESGKASYTFETELLGSEDIRVEKMMLALRTSEGVDASWLRSNADAALVDRMMAENCLESVSTGGAPRIRIPESHFFVSDDIIRELV